MNESLSSQSNDPAPTAKSPLRALLVEASDDDASLLLRHLEQSYQLQSRRVQDAAALSQALQQESWDVVVCDNGLPGLGVMRALDLVRQHRLDPALIVVSDAKGEDLAV